MKHNGTRRGPARRLARAVVAAAVISAALAALAASTGHPRHLRWWHGELIAGADGPGYVNLSAQHGLVLVRGTWEAGQ